MTAALDQSGSTARGRTPEHSPANRASTTPLLLDGTALLEFLTAHEGAGSAVRRAIYEGLAARIRRGDFSAKEDS